MTYLLDAHTLVWALDDPSKLGDAANKTLEDSENQLLIGTGTMRELSIKCGLTKLKLSLSFRQWMEKALTELNLTVSPITLDHVDRQTQLPFHHRDPFDRLLAAQALVADIPVLSADVIFDQYGVKRIWK